MNNKRIVLLITVVMSQWFPMIVPVQAKSVTSDNEQAKYLLQQILDSRQRVKNLQYIAEYDNWMSGNRVQELAKSLKKMFSEERLKLMQKELTYALSQRRYHIDKWCIDHTGRAKVEINKGTYDSSGQRIPDREKMISSWDGKIAIEYYEATTGTAAVLSNAQTEGTSGQTQPWRTCTGLFVNRLADVLKTEGLVEVEELSDRTYRVTFVRGGYKYIGIIDPTKGFSCTYEENYKDGRLLSRYTAEYKELVQGVWFPIGVTEVGFSAEGLEQTKSTIRTSQIKINDPNFHDGLFHVDFPKGTKVLDKVTGVKYVVGDPTSYRVYGDPNSRSVGEIVKDE